MLRIQFARQTGGKAGKGRNKTSTIQVIDAEENRIVKHFRYAVDSKISIDMAYAKAQEFIKQRSGIKQDGS